MKRLQYHNAIRKKKIFYTTIPHQNLKSRLVTIIRNSFILKNRNRRYKYFVLLGREGLYSVKEHLKSKCTQGDIIEFSIF